MALGLHPFYLFWVIGIFVVVALVVIGLVSALGGRSSPPPAYGLRSPDGQHWWDGRQWQPMPPQNGPGTPPSS